MILHYWNTFFCLRGLLCMFLLSEPCWLCCRKKCYFVDLFVRVSNNVAVDMYHNFGYIIYRKIIEYYSGDVDEDAYGEIVRLVSITFVQKSAELTA